MTPPPVHNSSAPSSGAGNTNRAAFRQEADRLVLTNPMLAMALSASDGTIVSLYHRRTQLELLDTSQAQAQAVLWRLRLRAGAGATAVVTNRGCSDFSYELDSSSEGYLHLRLVWSGLRAGAEQIGGRVTAIVTLASDSPVTWWDLELQLPDHVSLQSLDFPCVCGLGAAESTAHELLFLPRSGGLAIPDPRPAAVAFSREENWQVEYPGPAGLQMVGFSVGERATAWLAAGDATGARKSFVAAGLARSNRLALWITHHSEGGPDGFWSPGYPCCLGLVTGDWFEAAREYRAWSVEQAWCARGRGGEHDSPPLTRSYGLWVSHWGDARSALTASRELQRLVNVPIKLDWHCWHRCACGGAYPDYFPPRDGEQAFSDAKQALAGSGVLTQLAFNGALASPESEAWQAEKAGAYALRESLEQLPLHLGLTAMCPSTRYWREKLVALAREAVKWGAEGVYLEALGNSGPLACQDGEHGHGPPGPNSWVAAVRRVLGELNAALGRDVHLATDGPAETYLDVVDAFISADAAAEREGLVAGPLGERGWPIPLFTSVYHEYTTLIGPGPSLVSHRPHDPLIPLSGLEQRLPTRVMEGDYSIQFCLEVARAAAWGHQLMITGFSPEQTRDDGNRHKLAFLSTVLRAQAWGVGALIPYSEFMGSLRIDAPAIEASLLVNPPGSGPADRHLLRRSLSPVLGSGWRTPGAGLALVLINIHDQTVEFAAHLRSGRLGLSLPLQPIGRTFSEDGDVPAATLRASGSEIGGRIPGRSVVLLTLR